jgi:hypothetical protein
LKEPPQLQIFSWRLVKQRLELPESLVGQHKVPSIQKHRFRFPARALQHEVGTASAHRASAARSIRVFRLWLARKLIVTIDDWSNSVIRIQVRFDKTEYNLAKKQASQARHLRGRVFSPGRPGTTAVGRRQTVQRIPNAAGFTSHEVLEVQISRKSDCERRHMIS